ncbi:MAG: methylmalonyl-CoA mutase family protein [Gemmatimonadota bacterium]|nr:methylmalonyl-CoA mutase family protein [Gemmatimonadota bacterium]MDH3369647.1 methylmalonyl-CoA mutase family protein [Gemmatimonadota bacterium]MDH3479021.1 methylmalonyl-CoA mutase family protein [Gemmatimonadota bacterium]MDH3570674.1 methylmalonyl-CoA mutase family protein [Gemmatimonadota bacterium]MDH5549936.1 methylmalonyl-CoA mutase family protein [Gemmatimonadota bacterium]
MSDERRTPSGLPIAEVYGPGSAARMTEQPGAFPFTRGIHPSMYRGRLWTMRQYAGFGTAVETNRRFRELLDAGQTGLSVAFDLPTQMGYDSDDDAAVGEVGRAGVAVDTVDDLAVVFDGIPLDKVSTSMTINATASILLAMYVVVAEERGIERAQLRGTVQNDVLKEYVARGTYIFPVEPSLRLVTDVFRFVAESQMSFNPISISGYHMREAGATAVQEIGFTFANALEYLDRAVAVGLEIEDIAPRVSFFFAAHNDLFEEVAKFRAARRLWARLMRERYRASDRSCHLRFHTQTGGSTLTAQQPFNNVVRVTVQALAAILGGTQSLHTNSYDEALSLPSADAARLALRTQQILAHESGPAQTVDPLGGSHYVESLTDGLEAEARALLDEIDDMGGAARAIETGFLQDAIARSAYEYQRSLERGEVLVVGVNEYTEDESPPALVEPDYTALAGEQIVRVAEARSLRTAGAHAAALQALAQAASGPGSLMPVMVEAVRARATVGEISDTLRHSWGTFRPAA